MRMQSFAIPVSQQRGPDAAPRSWDSQATVQVMTAPRAGKLPGSHLQTHKSNCILDPQLAEVGALRSKGLFMEWGEGSSWELEPKDWGRAAGNEPPAKARPITPQQRQVNLRQMAWHSVLDRTHLYPVTMKTRGPCNEPLLESSSGPSPCSAERQDIP